jgi:hypothetical protein
MHWNEFSNEWDATVEDMIGRHFESVGVTGDPESPFEIFFEDKQGRFTFYHEQDCCETVYVESIVGDLMDLVAGPILKAEVVTQQNDNDQDFDSTTWTFYKFATFKGYVDIRWIGESNGYYSEEVSLKYEPKEPHELPHT